MKKIAGILLLVLAAVMIGIGIVMKILAPPITGLGFIIIGIVFLKEQ